MKLNTLFTTKKPVIGVIHLLPLPGSPNFSGDIDLIIQRALTEVEILKQGGVDGLIIENFHDKPFLNIPIPLEQYGVMASILTLARQKVDMPIGVNVHYNDWKAELTLAYTCNAQFIRVEGFVNTVVTAAGIIEPCCAQVTRYRKTLGAEKSIQIWADLHPKYSKNLVPYTLKESTIFAEEALADVLIVTGETTGIETPLEDIRKVKNNTRLEVVVGSGANLNNLNETLTIADAIIVGSAFKESGNTHEPVALSKVITFMTAVNNYR